MLRLLASACLANYDWSRNSRNNKCACVNFPDLERERMTFNCVDGIEYGYNGDHMCECLTIWSWRKPVDQILRNVDVETGGTRIPAFYKIVIKKYLFDLSWFALSFPLFTSLQC